MYSNLNASILERGEFIIEKGSHDSDVLIVVISGSFEVLINNNWVNVEKNECIFFRKNQYFERKVLKTLKILYITFDIGEEHLFAPKNCKLKIPKTRIEENVSLFMQHQNFAEHITNDIIFYSYFAKSKVSDSLSDKILAYIKENYKSKLLFKELCEKFYLSHSGIIYLIKKQIGQTPKQFLISVRLEKATELLLNTNLPICEIATMCGFKNEYYFSNAFKTKTTLSPTAYRKKYTI